jgi:uncharacterized protein YcfJ
MLENRSMKYLVLSMSIMAFMPGGASSRERLDPIDVVVYDHTEIVSQSVPTSSRECYRVDVPVYSNGTRLGSNGEVLGGAVVGAAIGNQFGGGNGKDVMTILGAIVGANSQRGPKNTQVITGYKQETRCNNVNSYSENRASVYTHSTIRFYINGKRYTLDFVK